MKNITGALVLLQFLVIVMGILVSFFSALYRGGGEIPREWRPENEEVHAPTVSKQHLVANNPKRCETL
jgi:hypothetical protein